MAAHVEEETMFLINLLHPNLVTFLLQQLSCMPFGQTPTKTSWIFCSHSSKMIAVPCIQKQHLVNCVQQHYQPCIQLQSARTVPVGMSSVDVQKVNIPLQHQKQCLEISIYQTKQIQNHQNQEQILFSLFFGGDASWLCFITGVIGLAGDN